MLKNKENEIRYFDKMVWFFIICSFIGLISEGTYTLLKTGHWESHVITLLLPLCPIYGIGAIIFFLVDYLLGNKNIFLKAGTIGVLATTMELLCGLFLYYCFKMRAWSYLDLPVNIKGVICPEFLVIWSLFGLIYLLVNRLYKKYSKRSFKIFKTKSFHIVTVLVSIVVFVDMLFAWIAIGYWSERHYGNPVDTKIEETFDNTLPDEYMKNRFIEWKFLDDTGEILRNEG